MKILRQKGEVGQNHHPQATVYNNGENTPVSNASIDASFYKYGDVNPTKLRSTLDRTDITVSLNYAYTFSLFAIKNKEERGIFKKKWMKRLSEISEGFSE